MNHSGDANKMVGEDHFPDAGKMVSDTPRTDAALLYSICLDLQDENNALKDRINRLEAVVNDPEALWTNWLRGDVKMPAGIGDVRQYQERIQRLEEAGDALKASGYFGGFGDAVNKWNKSKEAKP